MSDVDTKPAYQNLRHRVETTVKQFLEQQKWTPELNKLNLRERLRKHIAEYVIFLLIEIILHIFIILHSKFNLFLEYTLAKLTELALAMTQ